MDFLKRNLFIIACVVATGGGIALGVVGMKAMPQVKTELQKAESVYRSLDGLSSSPVNRARLDAEQRRIELIRKDHEDMIERARGLYGWELLVPSTCNGGSHDGQSCSADPALCDGHCRGGSQDGAACVRNDDCGSGGKCIGACAGVLPYGTKTQRLDFKTKYGQAMLSMFESLTSGEPATDVDIRNMQDRIASERAAVKEHEVNPLIPAPVIYGGPERDAAGVLTKAGAQGNAIARAHLQAAQRIYCYAKGFVPEQPIQGIYPSLEFDAIMANVDTLDPPFPDEVWNAHLGYWIQKDVVDAIVALNGAAATEAEARGEYGWVGNMPVKEIIAVRVPRVFVPPQGDAYFSVPPNGYDPAQPPGTAESVFTHDGSGESFDVVQFAVKLVMDQRDIQRFVAKLCNDRFYVPLRIAYAAVPPNKDMVGKIYGEEPAVIVVMEFELPLLGEVFRRWMPQFVRDQNGVVCREQDHCPAAED